MSQTRITDHLGHMLEAIRFACSYVDGLDNDGFLADRRTLKAEALQKAAQLCEDRVFVSGVCAEALSGQTRAGGAVERSGSMVRSRIEALS